MNNFMVVYDSAPNDIICVVFSSICIISFVSENRAALSGVVSSFNDVVVGLKNSLGKGSPNVVSTPVSDFASNSFYQPVVRAKLDNIVTKDPVVGPSVPIRKCTVDNPKVTLLNEVGTAVAKGFLVTESHKGICHGKQLTPRLKKVYVEEVLEPDARIFCPQSGMDTLAAYVEGGYLIWMESWLRMDE